MHDDDDAAKIDQDAQSPEAGAAVDEQGLGQHDDKGRDRRRHQAGSPCDPERLGQPVERTRASAQPRRPAGAGTLSLAAEAPAWGHAS